MIDFAELGRLNFKDQSALDRLDGMLSEVASFVETRTAAEVAASLTKKSETDPTLGSVLSPFIMKFRVLALPVLTDQQTSSLFSMLGPVLTDERIGLYERLRARILVLPASRREAFCQAVLTSLRNSTEKLGNSTETLGAWVTKFEQAGGMSDDFFKRPEFAGLDDATDHAVRHLIHVVTLLRAPDEHLTTAVQRTVSKPEPAPVPPPVPKNLPVAPLPAKPTSSVVVPAPVPPKPEPPEVVKPSPPVTPPAPAVATPSVAAVIARLHQSETGAEPPTVAHLSSDDEEEIEGHAKNLDQIGAGPNVHDTLAETIERMIVDLKLTFPEDNLRRRFVTIMTSRLKDIRSSAETVELLTRAPKVGGMGFDPELADTIVSQAASVAAGFRDEGEVKRMAERRVEIDRQPMPKPPKVPVAPEPAPSVQPVTPRPPVIVPPVPAPPPPPPPPMSMRPTISQAPAAFRSDVMPSGSGISAAMRNAASGRPTVSDIRGTSRLTGPIEELRQMTMSDYRRLGPDPISVIRRVYEKIQRLGKESFTKRAEGIKAWRDSDVYKLYITMGHEALGSGKTIRDVSLTRQQQGQDSLSEQEFTLIADLNRKLRF